MALADAPQASLRAGDGLARGRGLGQRRDRAPAPPAAASLDDALLAGSVELAASSGATALSADSLGALRLTGRLADGVRWSLGGLIAENEGRAWRMAAQFVIDPGGGHEIDAGAGYGAGDTRTLFASGEPQPDRTTGSVFARDRWQVSDRLTATAGGRYTYVGFLSDSHHADAILQIDFEGSPGTVVRGSVLTRSLMPGGDLLTLSTVAASPAITWARLDGGLRTARTLRYEVGMDHRSGPVHLGAYVFEERTNDILLTTFDGSVPSVRNSGEARREGLRHHARPALRRLRERLGHLQLRPGAARGPFHRGDTRDGLRVPPPSTTWWRGSRP